MPPYFASIEHPFSAVPHADGTPAAAFLDACADIVPFFDLLSSKAFYAVKTDINGNIKKLRVKIGENPENDTLQKMVEAEVEAKTTTAKNSATDALCWLKRALMFMKELLSAISKGERDLKKAANDAYAETLKKHHGFMVKKVFGMAMMAVPKWEGFVKACQGDSDDSEEAVVQQITDFVAAFTTHLEVLNGFYEAKGLEN